MTIALSKPLNPAFYYQITVIGSSKNGITDTMGRKLVNPQYGAPGANFTAVFFAGTFPQV